MVNTNNYTNKFVDFIHRKKFTNTVILVVFAIAFTFLLSSKHFFFRSIIDENNIAGRDVYSEKHIEVIDTFKTDQRKKELAQKLDPVLRPAEDSFIINDFDNLISSMEQIKFSNVSYNEKMARLVTLFILPDADQENFLASTFLNSDEQTNNILFTRAKHTLKKVLSSGINSNDIYENKIPRIIAVNTEPEYTRSQARLISALLEQVLIPNMVLDEVATEIAKKNIMDSVVPRRVVFEKGDKIISKGERVTKVKRDALLKAGYNIVQINTKGVFGIFALFLICIFAVFNYLKFFEKQFLNKKHVAVISTLSFLLSFVAVIIPPDWSVYLLPIPAFVIMMSIFTNPRTAFLITVVLMVMISSSLWLSASKISIFTIVVLFTTFFTSKVDFTKRFQLVKVGVKISVVMLLCLFSLYFLDICLTDSPTKWYIPDVIFGVLNCLFSGIIALGIIPIMESISGIITPYGLSELGDANQPLLKRLQFEAPGTFSHSMMVSTLAETAALAIGANAALTRVGALYHDVGKLKRPLFFIENQHYFGAENPHCKLNPRLSKMVIISHVKDGLELANSKEYLLPEAIQDFIAQHHGTTLASYFYTQAIKQEGADNVIKEQFRYPGPKPQTKETAIVMIADTVESASRTLREYSQEELETLINKLIVDKLNDGQLSEAPLTLHDLKIIAETLGKSLRAAHHQRIKYHDNIIDELENRSKHKTEKQNKILPENLKPNNDEG